MEQGCLEKLLLHRQALLPPSAGSRIATAPMALFNSPWGSIVRHYWGGVGKHFRAPAFDQAMSEVLLNRKSEVNVYNQKSAWPMADEISEFLC